MNTKTKSKARTHSSKLSLPVVAGTLFAATFAAQALPPVSFPAQNPFSEQKRVLGKILFHDEQMSTSNVVSCATCHQANRGGTDGRTARNPGDDLILNTGDDILGSPGIIKSDVSNNYLRDTVFGTAPQITGRAANSPINAAYAPIVFWDGRASGTFIDPQTNEVAIPTGGALESQAVGPLMNNVEMAHASYNWDELTAKLARVNPLDLATNIPADVSNVLSSHPDYPELFRQAFGDRAITARRIAFAIATYERTLIADQTPYDRFLAGQTNALTPNQQQGLQLMGVHQCTVCHAPPLFTDQSFRNIGLRPPTEDGGRREATGLAADRGKFKVPSLRNVTLQTTFMHNGQFNTLAQVLGFYDRAPGTVQFTDNQDPIMNQVRIPPQDGGLVTDFLTNGLTDPRVVNQTFPFDRPTLYGARAANQVALTGTAVNGSGNITPRIIAQDPPMVGNLEFRIGLDAVLGNAQARLGISSTAPVNGRITPERFLTTQTAVGTGNGQGITTFEWPLTQFVATGGQTVYVQWFITDAGATGGTARSQAARITFFCGSYGCPGPCPADVNQDGGVDGSDVTSFFQIWESGDFSADFNQDGGVDGNDIGTFFEMWQAGC